MRGNKLKKPIFILFALLGLLAFFAGCSHNDDDDDNNKINLPIYISLEGTALTSSGFNIRFVGAKTAYVTMKNSRISDTENLYSYTATADTITLQLQQIASPVEKGVFLSKDGFKSLWKSEEWNAYYILKDIKTLYQENKRTITDSEGTVYTYTNKITYNISSDDVTETKTTSGTKKAAAGETTTLFTGVAGYTEISSTYDGSAFAYVASVNVYSDTGDKYTDYTTTITDATVSEWESSYGSDEEKAQANIDLKKKMFEQTYSDLSNNNWNLLDAMFKPITFTYQKNYTAFEKDSNGATTEKKYDFYLTQRYTDFETAFFADETENYTALLCYSMFGLAATVSTSESSPAITLAYLSSADTVNKSLTFYSTTNGGDDNPDPENVSLIKASYTVNGIGEGTTINLVFDENEGSTLSKVSMTLKYKPISYGMTLSDKCY